MTLRSGDQLSAEDVYLIWGIRDAVFAFEQHVDDVDVDGRDLLPDTIHAWLTDAAGCSSYLRVLTEADGPHIGRVCTRSDARGLGLATHLMTEMAHLFDAEPIRLNAQAYLEHWYERLGYVRTGPNFDEAGIDHTPMIRRRGHSAG